MENEYFGILTEEMDNSFSHDEMETFLIEKNILEIVLPLRHIKDNKTLEKSSIERVNRVYLNEIHYDFSSELVHDIHQFLLNNFFKRALEINLMMVNKEFGANTYGLSQKKKRKEALKKFEKLFFELIETNTEKRLASLKLKRDFIINKLKRKNPLIDNYLFGNNTFFTRELIDEDSLLLEIFEFENKLSILIDLNKKFQFEEDHVFTPKTKAQMIFDQNPEEFHSLEQLVFIEQQLFDNKNKNRAFIVSLFYFFRDEINVKIPKADLFQNIIIDHFSFSFGKIKLSDPTNMNHQKRIKKMKNDWVKFLN
jgi:hypothetical protein